jgi:chemotaxis protein MotA
MQELSDPSKVGAGIATAFVATVYGVGLANLVAFPVARKIRARARTEKQLDKIVVAGIKAMREGMGAIALRQLLSEGLTPPAQSAASTASAPEQQSRVA